VVSIAVEGEIARAAAALEVLLDQSCTVSTPGTATADAYGGETPGAATTQTVICRVDAPTGVDQTVASRLGVVIDAVIRLKRGTVVTSADTITVNGRDYAVSFVNADEADQTMVRTLCRRVE
jgi:SPP1 family predicted phage head-tail adaptor